MCFEVHSKNVNRVQCVKETDIKRRKCYQKL